jgi:predicted metal-dependent phosphoesterase TrpH
MAARRTTRIDLHVHTRGSDGWGSPEAIAAQAVQAGLDGLAITDHHLTYTAEGLEVAAACREQGLLVVHGCEYSAAEGHVLIYGVPVEELRLPKYADMQKVIDLAKEFGGTAIPAHPFHGYRAQLGQRVYQLRRIRAVETANGQRAVRGPGANKKAKQAAKRRSWLGIGGSDAHDPAYVGVCYTEFQGVLESSAAVLQALKRGQFRAVTRQQQARELLDGSIKFWKERAARAGCRESRWTRYAGLLDQVADLDTGMGLAHFGGDDESRSGSGSLH